MATCFFLGAGASATFGYPVTSQIMPLIKSGLDAGTLFGTTPPERIAMAGELSKFLHAIFPGLDDPGALSPYITDVLSLVDYSITSSTTPRLLSSISELLRLRTLIEVAICAVISREWRAAEEQLLRSFWQWVAARNNARRDSVRLITTNYDCAIETRLSKTFRFPELTRKIDFGFDWRDPEREKPYQRPRQPWMRYYKLHGSLNWLRCDLCDHIYLNYEWEIWERVLEDLWDGNQCHCGHGKLGLVVVTPSYVRNVRETNLLEIWRHSVEALRTSAKWVIVGYSLPPDDISIRAMLVRAYAGRQKPPQVTIVTKGKDNDRDARYKLLFPGCTFETAGFDTYISRLAK